MKPIGGDHSKRRTPCKVVPHRLVPLDPRRHQPSRCPCGKKAGWPTPDESAP